MSKIRFVMPPNAIPWYQHHRDENNVIVYTTCHILETDTHRVLAEGKAEVSPRDNPCKKIGRDIARGRALKNLHTLAKGGPIRVGNLTSVALV